MIRSIYNRKWHPVKYRTHLWRTQNKPSWLHKVAEFFGLNPTLLLVNPGDTHVYAPGKLVDFNISEQELNKLLTFEAESAFLGMYFTGEDMDQFKIDTQHLISQERRNELKGFEN